jgi:RNA polymerase sigma-70 factor (ECF subfamily)
VADTLATLVGRQRRRLVAHVARRLGLSHLALAEDAVQVASLRALERWPADGVPEQPAAWLCRVALNHALDTLRGAGRWVTLPDGDEAPDGSADAAAPLTVEASAQRLAGELDDDELALLLAACHPALPEASQVALALRVLTDVPLAPLAGLLWTDASALAQRLARARQTLQGRSLALPRGEALAARREAVLTVLQLMFTLGLQGRGLPRAPGDPQGPDAACWEAIRLARAVAAHPGIAHPDADALAALLLFHGARLTGRLDDHGDMVMLPGQPRDRWDRGLVRMAFVHLEAAQRAQRLSRWHVRAGIAAEHAIAPSYDATDWSRIVAYHDLLLQLDPSPAPRLSQAIALTEAGEAERALSLLRAMQPAVPAALRAHHLAALAQACGALGDLAQARKALEAALACAPQEADRRCLQERLQRLLTPETEPPGHRPGSRPHRAPRPLDAERP